jgi:hypothetical protein
VFLFCWLPTAMAVCRVKVGSIRLTMPQLTALTASKLLSGA